MSDFEIITPSDAPAPSVEIVYTFMAIPSKHLAPYNWGTGPAEFAHEWDVNGETYINGIPLTVDGDYWMGYLLECVDRSTGALTFIAVNLYHGRRADGWFDHDFITYDEPCGTFGDRTDAAWYDTVGQWAVSRIYAMSDSYFEAKRK